MADTKITALNALGAKPADTDVLVVVDDPGGTPVTKKVTFANLVTGLLDHAICQGRLTLTTATPVTTADVTAATTLYFTPYKGDLIGLYDGSAWSVETFTERSIAIPSTTDTNYDVFLYDNAGTLTLELLAWTNDTTRATALATQDGVLVKTGALTRRYLGTIRTTSVSGQCEDSESERYVWNYYNRATRRMLVIESTDSWTYGTATWRPANNSTANRVEYVQGVSEAPVKAQVITRVFIAAGSGACIGIGVDATNANSADIFSEAAGSGNTSIPQPAQYQGFPGIGYHYLQWLEYVRATAGGDPTFQGDNGGVTVQSGLIAELEG